MPTDKRTKPPNTTSVYDRIYAVVRQVPAGRVATYGQVASIVGGCTARMVGYAMAALPSDSDVPWQRVINSQGRVSSRASGSGEIRQLELLEHEGVYFDHGGSVNMDDVRWPGPDLEWLDANGFDIAPGVKRRSQ